MLKNHLTVPVLCSYKNGLFYLTVILIKFMLCNVIMKFLPWPTCHITGVMVCILAVWVW